MDKKQNLFQCMESLLKNTSPITTFNKVDTPKCDHDHGRYRSVFYHKLSQFNDVAHRYEMLQSITTMGDIWFKHGRQCAGGDIKNGNRSLDHSCERGKCTDSNVKNGIKCCDKQIQNSRLCCEVDYQWVFVVRCLQILLYLDEFARTESVFEHTKTQNKQQHTPNFFGVNDQKTITGILQLVSAFGLYPFFSIGISRPLPSTLSTGMTSEKQCNRKKHLTILQCLSFMLESKTLNSIIMPQLYGDIIASFIQLGYEPLKGKEDGAIKLCTHERKWCRDALQEFLSRSYQPLIVKELLILQRCSTISSSKPTMKLKWFIKQIGQQLSKCIMVEQGVKNVIHAIFDGLPESLSWQHYDSIGKVIARPPSKMSKRSEYYRLISPQILELLSTQCEKEKYSMVCVSTIIHMLEHDFDATKEYLLTPMLECLSNFLQTEQVHVQEKDLKNSIFAIRNLLCTNDVTVPGYLHDVIGDFCHPLFLIFVIEITELFSLRKPCKEILISLMRNLSAEKCACVMHVLMFGKCFEESTQSQNNQISSIKHVRETIVLYINSVRVPTINLTRDASNKSPDHSHTARYSLSNLSLEDRIAAIIDVLNSKDLESVRGDVFVKVLQLLAESVTHSSKNKAYHQKEDLLQIERNINTLKYNIELVSFMSALIDTFGHSILQNTPQIMAFIKVILDWSLDRGKVDCSEVDPSSSFHDNTIDLVLMLLSTLLASNQLSSSDYNVLQQLLPSLISTADHHSNRSSRAMANDIKTFIATRGTEIPKSRQTDGNESETKEDLQSKVCYDQAMMDLSDPLLPTRGHALRQLSKLLKVRNKYAVCDEEKLFAIFDSYMKHDDTYLYLAAIDGLVCLVDVHHRNVMPLLCKKFVEMRTDIFNEMASHNRMKLCEAIIRSCQQCGEMLPVYKELVVSALMCGVKDKDELIRASALSGIGELCRMLKYSIRSIVVEVFDCVSHVVATDKSIEARRASVQVLSLLLKGLDTLKGLNTSIFQMIGDILKDLYKLLKVIRLSETDDITLLHVDNALAILDEIVKESFIQRTLIQPVI